MNRASLTVVSLAGIVLWAAQSGCVTRAQYDALYSAHQECESNRNKLDGDLKAANAQLEVLQKEKSFWISDRDGRINSLSAELLKASQEIDTRDARISQLQKLLDEASKHKPEVVIQGPILAPEVDKALKQFATDHPGLIEYDADRGLVRFSSDILFDKGSFALKPEMVKQISDFSEVVNIPAALQYDVLVVGHTDTLRVTLPATRDKTPTNWHLSVYRAVSVVETLAKAKVDEKRLGAMGFGQTRLRIDKQGNVPENRRVEIYLVPKGAVRAAG